MNKETVKPLQQQPLLRVIDLSIEFYDHLIPETVVHDFDITIYPGEIIGLVGESGSGKSMSALAIAGLLRRRDMQKRGQIIYKGVDLLSCKRDILRKYQGKDIGIIFQEPMSSLNPVLKIGHQVEEILKIHCEMSKQERYQRVIAMLAKVELKNPEAIYHKYPHELSGGMRQRVMIASAMIGEPDILIADEPTTALDVTVQAQIVELLKRINQEKNTAILFISHDLSLVKQLCTRVLVMKDGYVVEEGDVLSVFHNPQKEYTRKLINAIPVIPERKQL